MKNEDAHYWVIIPGAGMGSRFAHHQPKQYVKVVEKTILEHSIDCFLSQPWVKKIIMVLAENDTVFSQLPIAQHPKIVRVPGGLQRHISVNNALTYLKNQAAPDDWVLVHDAVRPCLHAEDLLRLVQTVSHSPVGGILAMPAQDTLKLVVESHIQHTIPRAQIWHAQTPQMFRLAPLIAAMQHCEQSGFTVTDEASAIEQSGHQPIVVEAHFPNPKLTTFKDLAYIEGLLS